jgi:SAM-dependent methyltransferase
MPAGVPDPGEPGKPGGTSRFSQEPSRSTLKGTLKDAAAKPTMNPPPSFPDHFSLRAAEYRARRPGYPSELVDWLAEEAPARDRAWDAGCGSGQFSLLLARRFRGVVACDASPEQVMTAPRHPGVAFRVATAEAPGLPVGSVDLAVAAQAAHWFDLDGYYRAVTRVTRSGGLLALVAYGVMELDPEVTRTVRAFHDVTLAPHWPPQRAHVISGYRSLPFPFPELTPPTFEIHRRWTLSELLGYVETWSAMRALERSWAERRRKVEPHPEASSSVPPEWARFRDALERAWGPPEAEREIRWPLAIRAGRLG